MEYISDRLEQILITLGETNEALTSAQLAEKVKVSARTIKKDVSELNAILKDYDAVIHARTGVGYKLSVNDEFLYNQFLTELKRRELRTAQTVPKYRYERVNYIVKKLLTVDYYLTIEDLVDELYISRSTLTADLKEVREIFKDYNLELTSRPNYGILLVGEEIAKRLCIAEYFFHANISTGYFAADNAMFVSSTNQDEIRFVRDLLEEIMEKYSIHMSDQSLQNFVIHIIIAIRRWKF
ncbi:MAG: BglG family transcription antiterminator [Holdemania massiliensis]